MNDPPKINNFNYANSEYDKYITILSVRVFPLTFNYLFIKQNKFPVAIVKEFYNGKITICTSEDHK